MFVVATVVSLLGADNGLLGDEVSPIKNFGYRYVILDGRVTAPADRPTERAVVAAKAAPMKGGKLCRFDFSKTRGGLTDKPLDLAPSAIRSKDGARVVILNAPVGRSVLLNLHLPCPHADPHLGHINSHRF